MNSMNGEMQKHFSVLAVPMSKSHKGEKCTLQIQIFADIAQACVFAYILI